MAPLVLGALAAGVTISTIDPSFNKDEILHIFGITRPKVVFCNGTIYTMVKNAFEEAGLTKVVYTLNHHPSESSLHVEDLLQSPSTSDKNKFV